MKYYEKLYFLKEDKKLVQERVNDFLLYQIYSVPVLRKVYPEWPVFRWFLRQNTPTEIQSLIEKSPYLSDEKLHLKLNEYHIRQAVRVLSAYQACDTPMTQDKTVPVNRYKLTNKNGDKALAILQNALKQEQFSDKMADLAVRSSHKFLMEDKYYLRWQFSEKYVSDLAFPVQEEGDTEKAWVFPIIQLTQGCLNHCSHCDVRAEAHLSHMPWPLFRGLYRNLNKYYRHYPQKKMNCHFSSFFVDSDTLDYEDPYMNVDSGDVSLWIEGEGGSFQHFTRGVKNERDKLALAKSLFSGRPFAISFVDTPAENMSRNLKQLNETLDIVEALPDRNVQPNIIHRHLKSGPTVSKEIFREFPLDQRGIHALGRAKDFPYAETEHQPDENYIPKVVFRPNGDLAIEEVKNDEITLEAGRNILSYQQGPRISRARLFFRRHILSHVR